MICKGLRTGAILGAALYLSACSPSVSSLDCGEIVEEAKRASQDQPVKINEVRNVREETRTETEARCLGEATWSNEEVSNVWMRAYETDNGTMVEYRNQPWE
ncbi:MAG: hypothetical protein M3N07_01485 [Pseudomonadota bacterium]|nr:hypothetical protein [Pseudomonadota bacterium]